MGTRKCGQGRAKSTQKTRSSGASPLRLALLALAMLAIDRFVAEGELASGAAAGREAPGSDEFVMAREAVLREKPSKESRFVGKLPGGSRVKLLEAGEKYLKVETAGGGSSRGAYLSRDVVSVFAQDEAGTRELVTLGRALAGSEGHRRFAAAFLLRASERLRAGGADDAAVEVLLGETAESLASSGGPLPPGLEVTERAGAPGRLPRRLYTGDAFRRAVALTAKPGDESSARMRERALAGALRQQYEETPSSAAAVQKETAAWLELAASAQDPFALRSAVDRAGEAALVLGGALVAEGRLKELEELAEQMRAAALRVREVAGAESAGAKLLSRSRLLAAMRGSGPVAFPQEARARLGPKEIVARIQGKPGDFSLTIETTVGGTHDGPRKKSATPVLPVPGSLRLAPDGTSAAWVEIASPTRLVPVVALLDRNEPARPVGYLSKGRAVSDTKVAHVLTTLSGYSADGQRLGVSILAWNETAPASARYSVVSAATGDLLFETGEDLEGFQRLIR